MTRWRITLVGLFLTVFAVVSLSGPGRTDSIDGLTRIEVACSLVDHGDSEIRNENVWFSVFPGAVVFAITAALVNRESRPWLGTTLAGLATSLAINCWPCSSCRSSRRSTTRPSPEEVFNAVGPDGKPTRGYLVNETVAYGSNGFLKYNTMNSFRPWRAPFSRFFRHDPPIDVPIAVAFFTALATAGASMTTVGLSTASRRAAAGGPASSPSPDGPSDFGNLESRHVHSSDLRGASWSCRARIFQGRVGLRVARKSSPGDGSAEVNHANRG